MILQDYKYRIKQFRKQQADGRLYFQIATGIFVLFLALSFCSDV